MRYAAWYAQMHTPDEKGRTQFASLSALARRGSEWAIKDLAGPKFPESVRYVWDWAREFSQGLAGGDVTWEAFRAWRREMGIRMRPHQKRAALLILDVLRNPDRYAKEPG